MLQGVARVFFSELLEHTTYYCLCVDTESPCFDFERFGDAYQAYNRFVRMAYDSAIPWFFSGARHISVRMFSDKKDRPLDDNFATYLPRAVVESNERKQAFAPDRYPELTLRSDRVTDIDSDPAKNTDSSMDCELTQLTDLLTSAIGQALTGSSGLLAKLSLGELVAEWVDDVRRPPWLQSKDVHRRFNVSCFPSPDGRFYQPELIGSASAQMRLF